MAHWSKDKERVGLEREIGREQYTELLRGLQGGNDFLLEFGSWGDVLVFMRGAGSDNPQTDEVLRPIFRAHKADQDPRWRSILLAIFWPGLEGLHRRKRYWDLDPEELWQTLTWCLLKTVCRIDVDRRPERLVQKVINDTAHRLHEDYRRRWDRMDWEISTDPEMLAEMAGGEEDAGYAEVNLRINQELELHRLRGHLEAGRICETDFLLLVGTRVYGRSVADYAREAGLDYQAAKKRRQRAEAAIRRHEGVEDA